MYQVLNQAFTIYHQAFLVKWKRLIRVLSDQRSNTKLSAPINSRILVGFSEMEAPLNPSNCGKPKSSGSMELDGQQSIVNLFR
mmetsp:Transcript_32843/g.48615  ORF Transcript_32843/g.48615 Transcript_32843/m.48615 type:complete len:83 (-) Transcript_32843:377-625(-)